MKSLFKHTIVVLLSLSALSVNAQQTFKQYVTALKLEAIDKGYSEDFIQRVFAKVKLRTKVLKADKNQPETKITLDKYLATRVPDWKVQQAVTLINENKALLNKVEREYGVQKRFIVALWGNESNFGKIMGKHPVISSLVSLAFDGRREELFKTQLFAALDILQQGHISQEQFLGSWAGAIGQSQFMPTSFLHYAVDFDGNGKKDIWHSKADVFASIANFLKSEGWNKELTWGRQVKVPSGFDFELGGLSRKNIKSLNEWQALGIRRYTEDNLPNVELSASLISPDGEKGRIYLVYENFHTLMKWNRSSYFGVSVSYLSDRIKKGY